MNASRDHPIVVKVGGSLYDLPDLGGRLRIWLAELRTPFVILVPGGGGAADVIRNLDRVHRLGEETSHWLALRSLTLNAHVLAALLPETQLAGALAECGAAHDAGRIAILDAWRFAADDEAQPDHLPHNWNVTSDSVAAQVAIRTRASALILLKSTDMPAGLDLFAAGGMGFVDGVFGELVQRSGLTVRVVNLRLTPAGPSAASPNATAG